MHTGLYRLDMLEARTLLAAAGIDIQVMTQNLYMGTDLAIVMGVESAADLPAAVSKTWNMMKANDFPDRATALSKDMAHAGPALIGLQEASFWKRQSAAGTEVIDYVQLLTDALAQRGVEYTPISGVMNVAAQLPDAAGGLVTFVDRDVILARTDLLASGDLQIADTESGNYLTRFSVPVADTGLSIPIVRGWALVDAALDGQSFRFVNTHLEAYEPQVQLGQAMELAAGPANSTLPTIVAGDFNSDAYGGAFGGPDATPTYSHMVDNGFEDTWTQTHNHVPGLTWGQAPDLQNVKSTVNERIDFLFLRSGAEAERSYLVGWNPGDRTHTKPRLWGSDHAGLVGTIDLGVPEVVETPVSGLGSLFQAKRSIVNDDAVGLLA